MKHRLIIGSSLLAMIIFLLVQFYTTINLYQVKSHDFDTRYNQMIREAMDELNNYLPDQGMDSMYFYLDKISFYFRDIQYVTDQNVADSLKKSFVSDLMNIIGISEPFSPVISYKLKQNNMDPNLKAGFIIRDFSIIDGFSSVPIIRNDSLLLVNEEPVALNLNLRGSLLDHFRAEQDYFNIDFDVYIDFTRKQEVIFKEMIGVLILITLSVFMIGLVFFFTLRNLMKQKKISDLKSDFINNMTHELKTPLSTISLANQGLSNDEILKDVKKIKEFSGIIDRQNKHLAQIIDRILDVSMWEKQQIKLAPKSLDIIGFVKDKINSFRAVHGEVEFKINIPNHEFYMDVDAFQFSIALNNLLENAVKYKRDPLKLVVDLSSDADEIVLRISDNGIGINPKDQKHIFNKFFRVDNSTIHNTKGLGLGLFYVKNIVEAHGGEIWLESELGKGTTFFIRFRNNKM